MWPVIVYTVQNQNILVLIAVIVISSDVIIKRLFRFPESLLKERLFPKDK